jgi:phosphatidate cytidylyltransferase
MSDNKPDDGVVSKPTRIWGDLARRSVTALAALLIVATVIYIGGFLWACFVVICTLLVLREWIKLVWNTYQGITRVLWIFAGFLYLGLCSIYFVDFRYRPNGVITLYAIIACVIFIDTFAYFAGRFFGGPKIAPSISPSKTWSGFFGGTVGAHMVVIFTLLWVRENSKFYGILEILNSFNFAAVLGSAIFICILTTSVAQSGDFFESWMKRRAGVKDSGRLLPGHGGIFDRVDGLLAVMLVAGTAEFISKWLPSPW